MIPSGQDVCPNYVCPDLRPGRAPEQAAYLNGLKGLGEAESVDSQVVIKRLEDGSFLILVGRILVGRQVSPDSMMNLYRKRWEILALFAALKSRGFGLEATHMTKPDRIRKLLGFGSCSEYWC